MCNKFDRGENIGEVKHPSSLDNPMLAMWYKRNEESNIAQTFIDNPNLYAIMMEVLDVGFYLISTNPKVNK